MSLQPRMVVKTSASPISTFRTDVVTGACRRIEPPRSNGDACLHPPLAAGVMSSFASVPVLTRSCHSIANHCWQVTGQSLHTAGAGRSPTWVASHFPAV